MAEDITEAVREFSGGVFRLACRIVSDREEALDLTQEAFVRVFQGRRSRDGGKLKAYLYRTAFNLALNSKRNRLRRNAAEGSLAEAVAAQAPEQPDRVFETAETASRVNRAVESLSGRQREAVTLRFYADLTLAEVARVMGVSQGSVKIHLARGLRNLKKCLHGARGKERL